MAGVSVPGRWPHRQPLASLRHNPASARRHLDWGLLLTLGAICGLGLVMIYSATRGAKAPYDTSYVKKQIMFMMIGGIVMAITAIIDYRRIRQYVIPIYVFSLVLLLAVVTPLGTDIQGTKGWFVIGPFQLQPSELAKLATILAISALAAEFKGEINIRRLVALIGLAVIPIGLIMLEPDLGQSLVMGCVLLTLLVVSGVKPRHLALLALLSTLLVFGVLKSGMLDKYQQDRLATFVQQDDARHSLKDERDTAYNLSQAKNAIGSGGVTGKGLFVAPLTKTQQVPEQRTDFIFTALGEQWGFAGAATLLTLYAILIWRIWRTAQLARDDFGSLLCIGILGMFLFQIFENAGMTMGIMPITGITLPFMSYGGSSLLLGFAALGLVLNVHMRRFS
jgi:rod shape determining protein RodA